VPGWWMHIVAPPGAILPVSSAPGLLQGAHSFAHYDYLISYILRLVP
jgi:hypothetical protein